MIQPSKPAQLSTQSQVSPVHRDSKREALVIDDQLENRLLLRRVLTNLGYRVETAVDGEQGWRKLLQRSYRFIVTDYEMPNLDGLQLIRRIRQCPWQTIRRNQVILHSAIDDAFLRRAVLNDNRTYFFPKPLDVRRLTKLLKTVSQRTESESRDHASPPERGQGLLRLALPLTNFRKLMLDR